MASYDDVMVALRNAHDAGDSEAATRLAQIANSMKTSAPQEEAGILTGIKQAYAGVGNTVDNFLSQQAGAMASGESPLALAGGLPGYAITKLMSDSNKADEIYKGMEDRESSRNQWANPEGKEISTAGKLVGAVASLPSQVLSFPMSPATTGKTAINSGETTNTAVTAAGVDTVGNVIGLLIGPGKTLYSTIAKQAGANAAQDYITKWVTQQLMSTEEGKKAFEPKVVDAVVAGIVGGAVGAASHTPVKKAAPQSIKSAIEELSAPEKPAAAADIVDTRTGLSKSKEAYQASLREKELQRQSAFHRPEQLGNLEAESPMSRMVRDLGGEPLPKNTPDTTMTRMADDLTANRSTIEQRAAQDVLEARQKAIELEVKKQQTLDFNAAERARQEKTPLPKQPGVEIVKQGGEYVAMKEGKEVGKLSSNLTPEQSKAINENANVDLVHVDKEFRGQGIGKALYEAWATDHEGKIAPSGKTSADAWNVWNAKYPEKVEDFVQQEANRIRQGAPINQVIGNITNPSIAQRVLEAATKYKINPKQSGKVLFGSSTKEKANLFSNVPGIKQAARDIGNALIRTPEQAISFAKQASDVSQNFVQRGFNALTKGGTYLKSRVNNPVVHFTVDKFLEAEGLAKGEINQKLGHEYLGTLRSLSKEEYKAAFDLLNAADLNKKTLSVEFMQKHNIPEKVQEFIITHQKMMDDVLSKINSAREAAGQKPVTAREAYSAMSMSGDYRKVAYKTIDGVKTVVGVIGADRLKGNLGWTLDKIEKSMLAKDPSLEFGPLQNVSASRNSSKGTPHQAFADALKTIGENNPHVSEMLEVLRQVAKDDPSNYMGMQKHTMQKKGVWGMEGRKPWETEENNATQFFENQVKYIESAYKWSHLSDAAKEVNKVLTDADIVKTHPNAVAMSEKYLQNALGLNTSKMGRAVDDVFKAAGESLFSSPSTFQKATGLVRSTANTMMLSLNQSFLMIQAIQGPVGIPAMVSLLRGRGLAPKATMLTQGLDYFVEASKTLVADKLGRKLSAVDEGAIRYAKKNHIYATDMVEHNSSTRPDFSYYKSKVLQGPAAVIETVTRAQAYLTFVKMMSESGLKPKDGLYEQAHRFTDQVMNNYSAMEKPPIYQALGQIGSMAYNLKSFGHNELSRWAMYAREIPATGNAVPLLTQMATTIAIAGVMGLPFYSQWESIYDVITKKMGSPRSLTLDIIKMSENLSKEFGDGYEMFKHTVSHGLPTLLGADVSKRVGMGDVVPSSVADAAFAGGSKLTDMVSATAGAITKPDERHLKAAAVALSPSVVASPLKSAWYTDEKGVYSTDPDKKRELITQINPTDRLLKKIGITGINESVNRTKDYQLKQIEKAYQDIRDKALVQISYDLYNKQPISQETIDKYFVNGQGDPSAFSAAINDIVIKQNIPRDVLPIINNAASKSITKAQSLQRRMYANQ